MSVVQRRVGEALRILRAVYDRPQSEVARAAGISRSMLQAYEAGNYEPSSTRTGQIVTAIVAGAEQAGA